MRQNTGVGPVYRRHFKRWLDVIGAACGIALLAPVFAVTATLVWWRLGRPVLFRQERPGLHGRTFRLLKFRSMHDLRGADGALRSDAERLLARGVVVERGAHVALGAVVLPGRRIGTGAVVGAGSVVTKDLNPRAVVMGVPARAKGGA